MKIKKYIIICCLIAILLISFILFNTYGYNYMLLKTAKVEIYEDLSNKDISTMLTPQEKHYLIMNSGKIYSYMESIQDTTRKKTVTVELYEIISPDDFEKLNKELQNDIKKYQCNKDCLNEGYKESVTNTEHNLHSKHLWIKFNGDYFYVCNGDEILYKYLHSVLLKVD